MGTIRREGTMYIALSLLEEGSTQIWKWINNQNKNIYLWTFVLGTWRIRQLLQLICNHDLECYNSKGVWLGSPMHLGSTPYSTHSTVFHTHVIIKLTIKIWCIWLCPEPRNPAALYITQRWEFQAAELDISLLIRLHALVFLVLDFRIQFCPSDVSGLSVKEV